MTHARKLVNITSMVVKLGKMCFGSKICVREAKMFFLLESKTCFCFFGSKLIPRHVSRFAELVNICVRAKRCFRNRRAAFLAEDVVLEL